MTRKRKQKNWLEWSVFGLGLLLVVPLLAYLALDAWRRPDGSPILHVELGEPASHGAHFGVPVIVTNVGMSTAGDVLIEVILEPAAGEAETGELAIDFVPARAKRHGWVMFRSDPKAAKRLEARVRGFREP